MSRRSSRTLYRRKRKRRRQGEARAKSLRSIVQRLGVGATNACGLPDPTPAQAMRWIAFPATRARDLRSPV